MNHISPTFALQELLPGDGVGAVRGWLRGPRLVSRLQRSLAVRTWTHGVFSLSSLGFLCGFGPCLASEGSLQKSVVLVCLGFPEGEPLNCQQGVLPFGTFLSGWPDFSTWRSRVEEEGLGVCHLLLQ